MIVQQLHSRKLEGYGVVSGGNHWFDESIKDWLGEVFPIISQKKMNSYLKSLMAKGVLEREHLELEDNSHNYSSKKRTYYYRLNYENLFNLDSESE